MKIRIYQRGTIYYPCVKGSLYDRMNQAHHPFRTWKMPKRMYRDVRTWKFKKQMRFWEALYNA